MSQELASSGLTPLTDRKQQSLTPSPDPGGDLTDVGADYVEWRRDTGELVNLIQQLLPQHFPHRSPAD